MRVRAALQRLTGVRCVFVQGAGDKVLRGHVQPYAYVQMDPAQLNRRKRGKAVKAFQSVVRGAAKGAASAAKRGRRK